MKQNALMRHPASDLHGKETVEATFEHILALAREVRQPQENLREATRHEFPDFSRLLHLSGRLVLANDVAAVFLACAIAGACAWAINIYVTSGQFQSLLSYDTVRQCVAFAGLALVAILWLDTKGHYRQRLPYWEFIGHIVTVTSVGLVGSGFIEFAFKDSPSRLWTGLSWLLFGVLLFASRVLVRKGLEKRGLWHIPALIVGRGATAKATLTALNKDASMGFKIVGHIAPSTLDTLKQPQAWKQLLRAHGACQIFLALEGGELEVQQAALKSLASARIPCSIVPPWLGLPSSTLSPHYFLMQDVLMLHDTKRLELPLPCILKRSFDCIMAALALVVLAPVLAGVALLVASDGGSVFFSQPRVGRHGRLFRCYKFRSMRVDAEQILAAHLAGDLEAAREWASFQKLKNDVRVTRFGQFIRRASLDELPQLFNVLKGDMSLVGPRPIMKGQEELYAEDFNFYASVRPGITGPWQVSGRSKLTFKQRVALESWYARNWSLWLDIVILLKTLPALLERGQAF